MRVSLQPELNDSQQFLEFNEFLKQSHQFGSKKEDIYLFYSYYLSRKIQEIVFDAKIDTNTSKAPKLEETLPLIFQNEKIKKILDFLKHKSRRFRQKHIKDRKTSFFRTIVKHLRRTHHQNISMDLGSALQLDNCTLAQIQQKLSHNTISNDDIQELQSKYGGEIAQYLSSKKVYKDILNVNKSKINKAFYLLHLKELSISAKTGKLSQYPFFLNCNFKDQVTNIVNTILNSRWQKKEKKARKKVDHHKNSTGLPHKIDEEEQPVSFDEQEEGSQLSESQNQNGLEQKIKDEKDIVSSLVGYVKNVQVEDQNIFKIKDGSFYFENP